MIKYTENTIETETGDSVSTIWACIRPQIVEYHLNNVPNYLRKWLRNEKFKISKQKNQKQRCTNHSECGN